MSLPILHVAAGVILSEDGRGVLLSQRQKHQHQGGLWEFPGGKCEEGESEQAALSRELHEELGIDITTTAPLWRIDHCYAECEVHLAFWSVSAYLGQPQGREGQQVRWWPIEQLADVPLPAANQPLANSLSALATAAWSMRDRCLKDLHIDFYTSESPPQTEAPRAPFLCAHRMAHATALGLGFIA